MPSDEEIAVAASYLAQRQQPTFDPLRALIRMAGELELAVQEAWSRREIIEALIYELDNATRSVCQGCAEGIDYWPADGSHRRQISDDGDCEGGPCNCHELSDRLHGLRAELAALEEAK